MISSVQAKVVVKFEASELMCIELRAKNVWKVYILPYTERYVNPSSSHVENTPQPCRQSTKLRIMISSVQAKVVVKFEASEMMCTESRAKKLWKVYTLPYTEDICVSLILTCGEHTSNMSPVHETYNYDY